MLSEEFTTKPHLKCFIDKHTLAIKDNEPNALFLNTTKPLSGVHTEAVAHGGGRHSAENLQRQHLCYRQDRRDRRTLCH